MLELQWTPKEIERFNKKCKLANKIHHAAFYMNLSGPAHPIIGNGKLPEPCAYYEKAYKKRIKKMNSVLEFTENEQGMNCISNRLD